MRLTLWILALSVPLLISAVVLAHLSAKYTTAQTESTLEQFLESQKYSISSKIDGHQNAAKSLTIHPTLLSMLEIYDQFRLKKLSSPIVDTGHQMGDTTLPETDFSKSQPLQTLIRLLSEERSSIQAGVTRMRLIDPTGKNLGESANFIWNSPDLSLAFRAMKQKKPMFGQVFESPKGNLYLPYIAPVYGSNRRAIGSLMIEFSVNSLLSSVNDNESLSGIVETYVIQTNNAGTPKLLTQHRAGASADTRDYRASDSAQTTVTHIDDGQQSSLIANSKLPIQDWYLIAKTDNSQHSALLASQKNVLLAAIAASVLIGLIGWILVLRPFNKRLSAIAAATAKMVKRDYSVRIGDKITDHTGAIARHIDHIAGELNEGISVRVAVEERLQQIANKDELTGLYNEHFLNEELERLKAEQSKRPLTIVGLKLTEYRNLKAEHGDAVAEQVLTSVAKRLRAALDHQYLIARKNGSEFVVVAEDTDQKVAAEIVNTINNIFTTSIETVAGELLIAGETAASTTKLSKNADLPTDVSTDSETEPQSSADAEPESLENATQQIKLIEKAVREQRVKVWYQPVVRLEDGAPPTLVSAEGFVRVVDEAGELIAPNTFMPHIQESPIGMVLDRCMLIQAIQTLRDWISGDHVAEDFCLSINLSRQSVQSSAIVGFLKEQLESQGVEPSRLALEITGDTRLIDTDVILDMQELGLLVSMDNVGLQHTNIDQLINIRPAFAKIDHRRLRSDNDEQRNRDIEKRLDAIWTIMGMEIIAKSVESADQISELVDRGIRVFQGFLFDHPREADSFIQKWGRGNNKATASDEFRKSA